jgi:hypothetical protein
LKFQNIKAEIAKIPKKKSANPVTQRYPMQLKDAKFVLYIHSCAKIYVHSFFGSFRL